MYLSYMQQKTRPEPALRACDCSRIIFTPPQPLEGATWSRFGRDLFISTKKAAPLDCFSSLSGKRDSSPRCARTIIANLYLHPRPLKGATWGRFVRVWLSTIQNEKRQLFSCLPHFERKTRLELALRACDCSRIIFTPPTPGRGDLGPLWERLVYLNEKAAPLDSFSSFERKTRLELATPTLARLCSTN